MWGLGVFVFFGGHSGLGGVFDFDVGVEGD